MNDDFVIDVHGLRKSFNGKLAVDDVSLRVPRGKIYGFLGPNGSGKTTTIRMICGLLTPDAGEGRCLGYDLLTQGDLIKQRIGYMTQKFSYWEDLTVRENLLFVADMFAIERADTCVETMLNRMGLVERADQLAGSLSGGWKQRLALAACMLHEPELLLLDEPTAGVDPQARRAFWDEIHRLASEGLTVLVSTHYMDEAERCHAIIYIAYSRLVVQGTASDVIAQAGLTTWRASGEGVIEMMDLLKGHPAVVAITPFGGALHISGSDELELRKALEPYFSRRGIVWNEESPTLEDAFIYFMSQSNKEAAA